MKGILRILFLTFLFFLFACSIGAADQAAQEGAIVAAQEWLSLVDNGQYSESWQQAAGFFKNAVTQEQWTHSMNAFRKPLGKVKSRKLSSSQYTTSLPGAPDGEYVVIQFETSFEEKKTAGETVTPMRDSKGEWRVSGYFIK